MKAPTTSPSTELRVSQGAKIKKYRLARAMTQSVLADQVEVTKAAVSDWERGASTPRIHHQAAIARALDTPWFVIFGINDDWAA